MKDNIWELLGLQIAKIRKIRNLRQYQLAESIEVATETVSRFERGSSIPSIRTLEKISRALETPIKEFFALEPQVPVHKDKRKNELSKIMILLQGKKKIDIELSYQVLKNLFNQLHKGYRPLKK